MKADMIVFSGTSHPRLADAISARLGQPLGRSNILKFSNDNIMVRVQENVREKDVFVVQSTCAPTAHNLMEALVMVDELLRCI